MLCFIFFCRMHTTVFSIISLQSILAIQKLFFACKGALRFHKMMLFNIYPTYIQRLYFGYGNKVLYGCNIEAPIFFRIGCCCERNNLRQSLKSGYVFTLVIYCS